VAAGADVDPTCIPSAKDNYRACKDLCKDDFRSAKLTCRGVEPTCGTACLAGRQACLDTIDAILQTGQLPDASTLPDCTDGIDGCRARLEAAKQTCGAPCAPGDQVCDTCVDAAQVTSFICRDTCRESWRMNATVVGMQQSCRDTFKACVQACPPIQ
jgi:hypothetical protein